MLHFRLIFLALLIIDFNAYGYGQNTDQMTSYPLPGLTHHLREAVAVNKSRKPIYASLTENKSRPLSRRLINLERSIIPFAWIMDRRAVKFQKAGIPIVAHDFVPMSPLPEPTSLLNLAGVANQTLWDSLRQAVKHYRKHVRKSLRKRNLKTICDQTAILLQQLEKWENRGQCHFAMCKHLLESVGLIALHGQDYERRSKGKSYRLTSDLIKAHLMGLRFFDEMDRPAQRIHQSGVGWLVNDLPHIPFLEEWEQLGK